MLDSTRKQTTNAEKRTILHINTICISFLLCSTQQADNQHLLDARSADLLALPFAPAVVAAVAVASVIAAAVPV